MIEMGIVCTYLTIISTAMGIMEFVVKIGEIFTQKVSDTEEIPDDEESPKKEIRCNIGKPLDFIVEEKSE